MDTARSRSPVTDGRERTDGWSFQIPSSLLSCAALTGGDQRRDPHGTASEKLRSTDRKRRWGAAFWFFQSTGLAIRFRAPGVLPCVAGYPDHFSTGIMFVLLTPILSFSSIPEVAVRPACV